jgi:hypothetical protein
VSADVGQHYDFDNTRVINFVPPDKLKEIIDFPLPAEGCGLTSDLKGTTGLSCSSTRTHPHTHTHTTPFID